MVDIKTLCQRSNITQQTFYRLVRDNKEFSEIVEKNREKKKNSYQYGETVLNWLLAHYEIVPEEQKEVGETDKTSETPLEASESRSDSSTHVQEVETLKAEIAALQSEIQGLQQALDEKEQERKALFISNNQLLLLLSQEKAEKQALLPKPKQTFTEKLRNLFKRERPEA